MAESHKAVFRVLIAAKNELRPAGEAVEVTLTVEGLPAGTRAARSMKSGGNFILRNLKAIAERGRPPFATRLMYALMGALEFMLPARTRAERWPLSPTSR